MSSYAAIYVSSSTAIYVSSYRGLPRDLTQWERNVYVLCMHFICVLVCYFICVGCYYICVLVHYYICVPRRDPTHSERIVEVQTATMCPRVLLLVCPHVLPDSGSTLTDSNCAPPTHTSIYVSSY